MMLGVLFLPLLIFVLWHLLKQVTAAAFRLPGALLRLPKRLNARRERQAQAKRRHREYWEKQYGKGYTLESINPSRAKEISQK